VANVNVWSKGFAQEQLEGIMSEIESLETPSNAEEKTILGMFVIKSLISESFLSFESPQTFVATLLRKRYSRHSFEALQRTFEPQNDLYFQHLCANELKMSKNFQLNQKLSKMAAFALQIEEEQRSLWLENVVESIAALMVGMENVGSFLSFCIAKK
jgi:hypothetical protein